MWNRIGSGKARSIPWTKGVEWLVTGGDESGCEGGVCGLVYPVVEVVAVVWRFSSVRWWVIVVYGL